MPFASIIKHLSPIVLLIMISLSEKAISSLPSSITWYKANFPPFSIIDGKHINTGYCNLLEDFIKQHSPEIQHTSQIANFSRILKELKSNKTICGACLAKSDERIKFIDYSVATDIWIPNGVIILKSNDQNFSSYIDSQGYFLIEKLVMEDNKITGIAADRVYGKMIDNITKKYLHSKKILQHSGSNVFLSLLHMLNKKRVDIIIGYPHELHFNEKKYYMPPTLNFTL